MSDSDVDSIDSTELSSSLSQFTSLMSKLNSHPDKQIINTLTMLCEDFHTSPTAVAKLYNLIRSELLNVNTDDTHKLPLIYLLDSLLHNADDPSLLLYKNKITEEIKLIYNSVYSSVNEKDKKRLERLAGIWEKNSMFNDEIMEDILSHSSSSSSPSPSSSASTSAQSTSTTSSSISLGTLDKNLLSLMSSMLQQMQQEMGETNPVTLNELAKINPELVKGLYEQALSLQPQNTSSAHSNVIATDSWNDVGINFSTINSSIKKIEDTLLNSISEDTVISTALAGTKLYLQTSVRAYKSSELLKSLTPSIPKISVLDDLVDFNSDNIKVYDERVVRGLYEGGLPCKGKGGRRFRTKGEVYEWERSMDVEKKVSRPFWRW
ncbi:hypothetical protein TL16_g08551 [Triparma laevis f. inornata]|uniref:CID domain-containing protein n=2 Tax=Triparma laevis TaxID=1534972 RepID=A0A9W7CH68_9STRA|nr:hypothetical protein TL16_g08551 [Triparma laevis f. inornata]GMI05640.1 hypothetical protein TrLO_g9227 [Triparma laevis f. longispina]